MKQINNTRNKGDKPKLLIMPDNFAVTPVKTRKLENTEADPIIRNIIADVVADSLKTECSSFQLSRLPKLFFRIWAIKYTIKREKAAKAAASLGLKTPP